MFDVRIDALVACLFSSSVVGAMYRLWLSLLLIMGGSVTFVSSAQSQHGLVGDKANVASKSDQRAAIIKLHDEITPAMSAYLDRKLDSVRDASIDVLVIEIDSPGGYADVSFDIARRLQSIRWAKTVAYVPREAISGAAIIALGADEIYMHRSALIGDCGVIERDRIAGPFRYAPEKVLSKYVADIRALAHASEHSQAIAEAMMNKDVEVFEATNEQDNRTGYFTKSEFASMPKDSPWIKGRLIHESRQGHFLTISGERAAELQLAAGVVESQAELMKKLHVSGTPIVLKPGVTDRVVEILNHPLMTFVLFVIGLLALFVEFSAPGLGMGGLVSMLCFGLFFWSRFLGGAAGWLEVLVFVMGLVFIACEVLIVPGFGLPGISGFLLVVGSLVMASRHVLWPTNSQDLSQLNSTLMTMAASVLVFIVLAIVCSRYLLDFPVFNRLTLAPQSVNPVGESSGEAGQSSSPSAAAWDQVSVGDVGTTIGPLRPGGKVDFGQCLVDVVSDGEFVESGAAVKVIQKHGTHVVVRQVD